MDDKSQFPGKSPTEESFSSIAPFGVKSVFDFNSLSSNLSLSECLEDFGRESLGIIDLNHPDFGRESLCFLHHPRTDDFGVTSLKPTINISEVTDVDSIGNCDSNSVLNTAFLIPSRVSISSSSVSSFNSGNVSFNSASLNSIVPSRIFSSCSSYKSDIMNEAFMDTFSFMKQLQLSGKSSMSTIYLELDKKLECLNKPHQCRIQSLPSALEFNVKTDSGDNQIVSTHKKEAKLSSPDRPFERLNITNKTLPDIFSFHEVDDEFNDSVFIEAHHVAWRLADGSLPVTEDCENDMLDSIQEPEGFTIQDSEDEDPVQYDTETVFKTVNKMLPPLHPREVSQKDANSTFQNNLNSSSKISCKNEVSNISSVNKSNDSNSRDPREILHTLSEILNNDNPSKQQKSEGQNLLSSLAEILISSGSTKSNSLDDSGHSSIESEPVIQTDEVYEVLDLRKKSSSENSIHQDSDENCVPLDLSLKSKSNNSDRAFNSPKILPPKFASQQKILIKENKSVGSNCSASSNESKSLTDLKSKFRPKKTESKLTNPKKGPLKAVIPLDSMSRRKSLKSQATPTKSEPQTSNYKIKKTSTPINELNLKPMAQSTPDGPSSNASPRPNTSANSSPKSVKQRLNYSGSNSLYGLKRQDSKSERSSFIRRRSFSDSKKTQGNEKTLARSYSVGEHSGLSSTASKVKERISKNVLAVKRNSFSKFEQSTSSVLKENRNKSMVKPLLAKRNGKENVY